MKDIPQAGRAVDFQSPTATCVMRFQKRRQERRGRPPSSPVGRIPRVTRLLALTHRFDEMIRRGEIKSWAEAARLVGVTRARMTQIANLLLLAPDIQDVVLELPPVADGRDPVNERGLRKIVRNTDWSEQRSTWSGITVFRERRRPQVIASSVRAKCAGPRLGASPEEGCT